MHKATSETTRGRFRDVCGWSINLRWTWGASTSIEEGERYAYRRISFKSIIWSTDQDVESSGTRNPERTQRVLSMEEVGWVLSYRRKRRYPSDYSSLQKNPKTAKTSKTLQDDTSRCASCCAHLDSTAQDSFLQGALRTTCVEPKKA